MKKVDDIIYGCVPQYYWKPVCEDCCYTQP
jgi:hypothetical protein